MDSLPHSLLLQILSRLSDSADVTRCRVASKAFNTVFPHLRSINLQCSVNWYINSTSKVSNSSTSQQHIKPFKKVFLDLISKLRVVESVCVAFEHPIICMLHGFDRESDEFYVADGDFVMEWLPMVSESLKSLSICGLPYHSERRSNVLPLISSYCHNLLNLNLKFAWLSVDNLNPMPMLTSLTLTLTKLEDEHLNELNKCFPNLQVLNLIGVRGLKDPKIHLLYLKTCHWVVYKNRPSLTLITPNLITLRVECMMPAALRVEAPMLSHFHLRLNALIHVGAFVVKTFENLKTLCLECYYIGSLLSEFPITKTVENLTLDSRIEAQRDATDIRLTLGKVFMVFPNVSSLCIKSGVWSKLEACLNLEDWEILDGRKGLKTICAYLMLVDPSLTFSSIACVLDQCVGLLEVSLLIHGDVVGTAFESFMSKCMARWPGLKWRWGTWSEEMDDSWITDIKSS